MEKLAAKSSGLFVSIPQRDLRLPPISRVHHHGTKENQRVNLEGLNKPSTFFLRSIDACYRIRHTGFTTSR